MRDPLPYMRRGRQQAVHETHSRTFSVRWVIGWVKYTTTQVNSLEVGCLPTAVITGGTQRHGTTVLTGSARFLGWVQMYRYCFEPYLQPTRGRQAKVHTTSWHQTVSWFMGPHGSPPASSNIPTSTHLARQLTSTAGSPTGSTHNIMASVSWFARFSAGSHSAGFKPLPTSTLLQAFSAARCANRRVHTTSWRKLSLGSLDLSWSLSWG
jgi:hypothetical protein